jgi:23S rRNA-/tRNA-specific pseudouridylate synthase
MPKPEQLEILHDDADIVAVSKPVAGRLGPVNRRRK